MKKIILQINKKLILPLLIAVLLFNVQVNAGVDNSCTVSIPVEIQNQGSNIPSGTDFTLKIEPVKTDNPMPISSEIIVVDNGKSEFGPISYNTPGMYRYYISQKAGDNNNFTYDASVYTLTVHVYDNGQGDLSYDMFAVKDGSQEKVSEILFTNMYNEETTTETVEPTETVKPEEETTEVEKTTKSKETTEPAETETTKKSSLISSIAPKTGERAFSAIIVGMLGMVMLILSIVFYKKKQESK